jgi:hypothetical protein
MATIVPKEIFLAQRAMKETARAVSQISQLFHNLAEAMRAVRNDVERGLIVLDAANEELAHQKASHDRLYRQFQSALDSPNLETLIEARDAYLRLHHEECKRRALRKRH